MHWGDGLQTAARRECVAYPTDTLSRRAASVPAGDHVEMPFLHIAMLRLNLNDTIYTFCRYKLYLKKSYRVKKEKIGTDI
jgi:hypothetical protein